MQALVADEEVKVESDRTVVVAVQEVIIPPRSIVVPSFDIKHALGYVVGALGTGTPTTYDERREVRQVIFHPIANGTIQRSDLLGMFNIMYSREEFEHDLMGEEVARLFEGRDWFG